MDEQLCGICLSLVLPLSHHSVYVVTHNAGVARLTPPAVIEGFRSLVYNSLSFLFPQAVFKLKITRLPIHPSIHHL